MDDEKVLISHKQRTVFYPLNIFLNLIRYANKIVYDWLDYKRMF